MQTAADLGLFDQRGEYVCIRFITKFDCVCFSQFSTCCEELASNFLRVKFVKCEILRFNKHEQLHNLRRVNP